MSTKRLFPGPAGVVYVENKKMRSDSCTGELKNEVCLTDALLFEGQAWTKIRSKIAIYERVLECKVVERKVFSKIINIQWIRLHALTTLKGKRIPFVVGVLTNGLLKTTTTRPRSLTQCVELKDETGTMSLAVDSEFTTRFGDRLLPGAAIALKNVGLLRVKNELLLTLQCKNVVMISGLKHVSAKEELQSKLEDCELYENDGTCFTQIQQEFENLLSK